ncbi:MAG: hypothetical protein ACP5R4_03755, partial [Armatimonadota bacterium]
HIRFSRNTITVCTDAGEVAEWLARSFSSMLVSQPRRPSFEVQILRNPDGYRALRDCEAGPSAGRLLPNIAEVRREVAIMLMETRPELLWLHAGAAAKNGAAVLLPGPWGSGKSSIVTSLCTNGWLYLSDDMVGIDTKADTAVPFPITPLVREPVQTCHPNYPAVKREFRLGKRSVCRKPQPITAVVFPEYKQSASASLTRCDAITASMKLLEDCMNFRQHGERAVAYVAELVKKVPIYQLHYSSAPLAAAEIERALEPLLMKAPS